MVDAWAGMMVCSLGGILLTAGFVQGGVVGVLLLLFGGLFLAVGATEWHRANRGD